VVHSGVATYVRCKYISLMSTLSSLIPLTGEGCLHGTHPPSGNPSDEMLCVAAQASAFLLSTRPLVHAPRCIGISACDASLPTLTDLTDPREWLEDVEGEDALNWVRSRNEHALEAIGEPSTKPSYSRVLSILDSNEKIPYIGRVLNGLHYNFWQDDVQPKGILPEVVVQPIEHTYLGGIFRQVSGGEGKRRKAYVAPNPQGSPDLKPNGSPNPNPNPRHLAAVHPRRVPQAGAHMGAGARSGRARRRGWHQVGVGRHGAPR
jgi:hypothetical protein